MHVKVELTKEWACGANKNIVDTCGCHVSHDLIFTVKFVLSRKLPRSKVFTDTRPICKCENGPFCRAWTCLLYFGCKFQATAMSQESSVLQKWMIGEIDETWSPDSLILNSFPFSRQSCSLGKSQRLWLISFLMTLSVDFPVSKELLVLKVYQLHCNAWKFWK